MKIKIVKDKGGQGKQIDGNGKTSGEVEQLFPLISFYLNSFIINLFGTLRKYLYGQKLFSNPTLRLLHANNTIVKCNMISYDIMY